MRFTLSQAAKEAGVSKGTLSKALQSGRMSGERREDGSFQIEAAELFRVFPRKLTEPRSGTDWKHPETAQPAPATPGERVETGALEAAELRVEVRLLREQLERERDTVGDLRKRLDRAEDRVLALSAPAPAERPSRGLLARLLRR